MSQRPSQHRRTASDRSSNDERPPYPTSDHEDHRSRSYEYPTRTRSARSSVSRPPSSYSGNGVTDDERPPNTRRRSYGPSLKPPPNPRRHSNASSSGSGGNRERPSHSRHGSSSSQQTPDVARKSTKAWLITTRCGIEKLWGEFPDNFTAEEVLTHSPSGLAEKSAVAPEGMDVPIYFSFRHDCGHGEEGTHLECFAPLSEEHFTNEKIDNPDLAKEYLVRPLTDAEHEIWLDRSSHLPKGVYRAGNHSPGSDDWYSKVQSNRARRSSQLTGVRKAANQELLQSNFQRSLKLYNEQSRALTGLTKTATTLGNLITPFQRRSTDEWERISKLPPKQVMSAFEGMVAQLDLAMDTQAELLKQIGSTADKLEDEGLSSLHARSALQTAAASRDRELLELQERAERLESDLTTANSKLNEADDMRSRRGL